MNRSEQGVHTVLGEGLTRLEELGDLVEYDEPLGPAGRHQHEPAVTEERVEDPSLGGGPLHPFDTSTAETWLHLGLLWKTYDERT